MSDVQLWEKITHLELKSEVPLINHYTDSKRELNLIDSYIENVQVNMFTALYKQTVFAKAIASSSLWQTGLHKTVCEVTEVAFIFIYTLYILFISVFPVEYLPEIQQ